MSTAEVSVYGLSDLNTACRKLDDATQQALASMEQELERESSRLEEVRIRRVREFERCEAAYELCRSYVDEDGYSPPCTGQYNAMEEARRELDMVLEQINHFAARSGLLSQQLNNLGSSMAEAVSSARRELGAKIDTLLYYLRSHPEEITGIGGSHHSGRYRGARREMIIRTARGEFDTHTMNVIQPQMINQVNADSGYFRSPIGYHASHLVRGIHIPENLTWEHRAVNQARYWEARRLGLTRDTAYG
jgi:hypothetical protein